MIRIIVSVIFIVFAFPALSQKGPEQTLLLNNGSRLSGIIVNDSSGNYILKLSAPQIISVPGSWVSSVEGMSKKQYRYSQRSGYYLRFGVSMLVGKSDESDANMLSISLSNGYKFRNGLMVGIGTGIEEMTMPLLPVYSELHYHPFNTHASPFIFLKTGYAFSLSGDEETDYWYGYTKESKGGFLLNAGAGIVLNTWEKVGINLALGYRFQQVSVTENSSWSRSSYATEYVTRFNRLELQLGLVFR
jgi:hypothetical protein